MKKTLSAFVAILSFLPFLANAQWTTGTGNINNTNTGNVGIGTTTPGALLSVGKELGNGTSNVERYLNLTNGTPAAPFNGNGVGMSFSIGNNYNAATVLGALDVVNESYNTASSMRFYTTTGSALSEKMRLDSRGYLGVGTTTPTQKLTVSTFGDGSSITPLLRLEQYNAGSPVGGTGVSIDMAIGDNYNLPMLAGQVKLVRSDFNNSSMYFSTALANTVTDRMVINPFGSVGIGTLTPDAKLSVNGDIHTQEVRVDMTGWSDYVFKPAYKLPSLSEVKTYIDHNQHLPEVPSEADVKKDGVNLGEMNKLLLKKVEELTLYLIEKDKQLTDQQQVADQQQTQLKQQDARIAALEKALSKSATEK